MRKTSNVMKERMQRLLAFFLSVKFLGICLASWLLLIDKVNQETWSLIVLYLFSIRFGQRFKSNTISFEERKKDEDERL